MSTPEHPFKIPDGKGGLQDFFVLAGQANNSSAYPEDIENIDNKEEGRWKKIWKALDEMKANTLQVPIYWEVWQPEEPPVARSLEMSDFDTEHVASDKGGAIAHVCPSLPRCRR